MSELIRLQNIHKSYEMGPDLVPVLKGVDLVVNEGEFVAIMGASGSGKSTLLHIAGVLDQPDEIPGNGKKRELGEVYFRGKPVSALGRWGRHKLRNHQFGFVFQFYHLLPELNVLENVLLPAMVDAPMYKALIRARPRKGEALTLLDAFGLTQRLKHRPGQLSGGERQRVAIARALINQPALLLADEPTGNLDAKTGRTILDVLLGLHRDRGQTMLLVTHDPNVAKLADRTVHLAEGRIVG
ncbi:MAG: ABC transporter ATP-binding protein [Phycisphaerae bacterium]